MFWHCKNRKIDLSKEGMIMGILNVTPDSFSDGGQFVDSDTAVAKGMAMIADGAKIIDIGGESTRPGAEEVSIETETLRVLPVIKKLRAANRDVLISVDTSKAELAELACDAGADIINDVTGLMGDDQMINAVRKTGAGIVIMHMQGKPRTMQANPHYKNVVEEVREFFEDRLADVRKAGISEHQVVFDPGIGFGKSLDHNLELLRAGNAVTTKNRPVMLGVSRKSMFGKLLGLELEDRLPSTIATTAITAQMGIKIHRVHDVKPNVHALKIGEVIAGF